MSDDDDQARLDFEQLTHLEPFVQEFLKEPLSEQARKAQALSLTFSAIGVAVGLGLVRLEKIDGSIAKFEIVGNSALLVLASLSLFFLVRFLLYYSRDIALFKWTKGRAALGVTVFFRPIDIAIEAGTLDEVGKRYKFSQGSFAQAIDAIERSNKGRKLIDLIFPILVWIAACVLLVWSVRWPAVP